VEGRGGRVSPDPAAESRRPVIAEAAELTFLAIKLNFEFAQPGLALFA